MALRLESYKFFKFQGLDIMSFQNKGLDHDSQKVEGLRCKHSRFTRKRIIFQWINGEPGL
jgi:hypothetical protein